MKRILKLLAKPFLWIENWWNRRSKLFKRLFVLLFICPIFMLGLLFIAIFVYCVLDFPASNRDKVKNEPYIWGEKELSERLVVNKYSNGTERLYDKQEKKYIMDDMSWVSDVSDDDTLAVIAFPGKRGFINVHTAEIVIEPQYQSAWVFSEGLAAVRNQDGKVGFINNKNEVIIPFQFDAKDCGVTCPFIFKSGYSFMSNSIGLLGVIDKKGASCIGSKF